MALLHSIGSTLGTGIRTTGTSQVNSAPRQEDPSERAVVECRSKCFELFEEMERSGKEIRFSDGRPLFLGYGAYGCVDQCQEERWFETRRYSGPTVE
jgi:hypothetical protein